MATLNATHTTESADQPDAKASTDKLLDPASRCEPATFDRPIASVAGAALNLLELDSPNFDLDRETPLRPAELDFDDQGEPELATSGLTAREHLPLPGSRNIMDEPPESEQPSSARGLLQPFPGAHRLRGADVGNLDYDEDRTPTRVDGKRRAQRLRAGPDHAPSPASEPVMLLTARKTLPSVPPQDHQKCVDVVERLRPGPSLPRLTLDPKADATEELDRCGAPNGSSILPVALSTPPPPFPQPAHILSPARRARLLTVGLLAAAVAAFLLWPSGQHDDTELRSPASAAVLAAPRPPAPAIPVPAPQVPATPLPTAQTHVLQLPETLIRGTFPGPAPSTLIAAAPAENLHAQQALVATSQRATTPPAPPPPFDQISAAAALDAGASAAQACREIGTPPATARVAVTFAPSGRVTTALVEGPYLAGTAAGGCVARAFQTLRISPFSGQHVTVHKRFVF